MDRATLVVTRPRVDAGKLVDALREQGHPVVAFPVLGIEPVADATALAATMARVADYGLVVFVSPNAIRAALAHRTGSWPADTTIGVMGPGSVAALASCSIDAPPPRIVSPQSGASHAPTGEPDATARFDSEALLDVLRDTIGLGTAFAGRVLIVRGNGGRAWLGERLREFGLTVDEIESYRRVRPDPSAADAAALRGLFDEGREAIVVLTSSEGVDNFVAMAMSVLPADGPEAAREWLFRQRVVAPHQRIAAKARDAGFRTVQVTDPGDAGILAALG